MKKSLMLWFKQWCQKILKFQLLVSLMVSLLMIASPLAVAIDKPGAAPANAATYNIANGAGKTSFVISTPSGKSEMQLAKHLQKIGATLYGAYWCPHCARQLELFGAEADPFINHVECAQDGKDPQIELCAQKLAAATQYLIQQQEMSPEQRAGFPTWELKGKFLVGTQSLESLAKASDYRGPQEFQS
jgi:hypothetical protein